jgi:acyl-CoA synthetase (NDP forming)
VDLTSDVLGNPSLGYTTLKAVADDPDVGIILYPFPCDYEDLTGAIADAAVKAQAETKVPIVPVWMTDRLGPGWVSLVNGGLMPMRLITQASKAAQRWIERGRWVYPQTWEPRKTGPAAGWKPRRVVRRENEAKAILRASGIRVPAGEVARSADEAARIAARIGFPVVAKISSADITHKSDVGGVLVNLRDERSVWEAYEKIISIVSQRAPGASLDGVLIETMAGGGGTEVLVGVHRDPIFGHVMTFGLGGVYIELFKDVARRLLPLTRESARALIHEPRCSTILSGARGRAPADLEALEELLLAVSDFVSRQGDAIVELEMNPVWVGEVGQGALTLDAVLVMNEAARGES